jgi:hypothetical protein
MKYLQVKRLTKVKFFIHEIIFHNEGEGDLGGWLVEEDVLAVWLWGEAVSEWRILWFFFLCQWRVSTGEGGCEGILDIWGFRHFMTLHGKGERVWRWALDLVIISLDVGGFDAISEGEYIEWKIRNWGQPWEITIENAPVRTAFACT